MLVKAVDEDDRQRDPAGAERGDERGEDLHLSRDGEEALARRDRWRRADSLRGRGHDRWTQRPRCRGTEPSAHSNLLSTTVIQNRIRAGRNLQGHTG